MPVQTYDFSVPGEYTTQAVDLSGGDVQLAPLVTTGTVKGEVLFKGIRLDSFAATEVLNGGTILYGLEIDTVLMWHNGSSWVPSDGLAAQLNTKAQVQANVSSAMGLDTPIVKPFVRVSRTLPGDPTPVVDDLVFTYTTVIPNRQIMLATDAAVALNTGVGGAPSPGETRVTLDPLQIIVSVGSNNLWVFQNGLLQPITVAYIEEDPTHVVFSSLLDATAPGIDEMEFRTARQGSSLFLPAPTTLSQARPPARPDNFGGNFEFA